jgi:hypothetical protein
MISPSVLHRMRNVTDKTVEGNQHIHLLFNNLLENRAFCEIMWKTTKRVRQATNYNNMVHEHCMLDT